MGAKDAKGQPYYKFLFDLKDDSSVRTAPVNVPVNGQKMPVGGFDQADIDRYYSAKMTAIDADRAAMDKYYADRREAMYKFYLEKRIAEADYWDSVRAGQIPQVAHAAPDTNQELDDVFRAFGVNLAESEIESEEEGQVILTVEEQREVAIYVVIGIFSLLSTGLLVVYIYDQMTKNLKPLLDREKQPQPAAVEFIVEEINPPTYTAADRNPF